MREITVVKYEVDKHWDQTNHHHTFKCIKAMKTNMWVHDTSSSRRSCVQMVLAQTYTISRNKYTAAALF